MLNQPLRYKTYDSKNRRQEQDDTVEQMFLT